MLGALSLDSNYQGQDRPVFSPLTQDFDLPTRSTPFYDGRPNNPSPLSPFSVQRPSCWSFGTSSLPAGLSRPPLYDMNLPISKQQNFSPLQRQMIRSHSHPETIEAGSGYSQSPFDDHVHFSPSFVTPNPQQQGRPMTGRVAPRIIAKRSEMIPEKSDSSDDEGSPTHPNKFAVAVEEHKRPECRYKRQVSRSGSYVKVIKDSGEAFCMKHNPSEPLEFDNGASKGPPQIVKYYRKDLVRVCRCGEYTSMEHMLENTGRANDAEGYEIHYNQKCKWKFYEDFKTKKRVLIRLCKCYKPAV